MKSTRVIQGALATFAAFSLPAFAGEPGPYLKPYHPPVKTTTSSSYSTSYSHSSSSYATSDLNRQAYDDLSRRQSTAPKYVYTRPAPQPVNPCYQPNPCAAPQTTYTTGAVTRTYTQTPTTTYRAPAPVNPCYQPNPCGTRTQTYTQPAPAYDPPPAYAPPPPPYIPPPAPPQWLAVNDCGHKVIRRLKDGRDGERRYEVCYSDLNHLSAYDRNSTLLERIELASRKACDDHGFSFYSRRGERKCRTDSTEDAVYAANVPGLVEFYYAKTGKRRPNVQVGAPIYY